MRAQRGRRKPPSRHAREQQQADQQDAEHLPPSTPEAGPASTNSVEPPEVTRAGDADKLATEATSAAPEPRRADPGPPLPKEKPARELADKPATDRSRVRGREPVRPQGPPAATVVSLRGEAERKQVEVAALSWAATARKLAEREQQLRTAIEAAVAAGTPPELIIAALVQAEARAGFQLPEQVRSLAQRRRSAR
jgi:hypothetical protein